MYSITIYTARRVSLPERVAFSRLLSLALTSKAGDDLLRRSPDRARYFIMFYHDLSSWLS